MPSASLASSSAPVLILGGGIHGAAVARELALNSIPVVLVDTNDLATGATSKSSRLIHGGLRYLEYGDVGLVRESLIERRRLLNLAPHLVRPLRLFVPTSHRWSGLLRSALGFFKLARTRVGRWLLSRTERRAPRGFWPVRLGLWMYDLLSLGDGLPKSRVAKASSCRTDASVPPQVDPARYRWLCEYSDAQMLYPERCVFALLADAELTAHERGSLFQIVPHARLRWNCGSVEIEGKQSSPLTFQPSVVINTSGAWGDMTLKGIDSGTTPLFAGTKGSHFVTRHSALQAALGANGVYAETGDRRLAFVLPFGDAVLVGTTDERWSASPETAVASERELDYLLSLVREVFGLTLSRSDIESHYSGVRPLPRTTDTSNAAVSRDHSLTEHRLHGVVVVTLVGGKLTTFRSVAEEISNRVLRKLGRSRQTSTRDRVLVGGENFPRVPAELPKLWRQWATEYGTTVDEVGALWPLYGTRTKPILAEVASHPSQPVADTPFTRRVVRWVIEHEWVAGLDDLIERRLMLIFAPGLSTATLHDLADCLVATGRLPPEKAASTIEQTRERLRAHYGRTVPL